MIAAEGQSRSNIQYDRVYSTCAFKIRFEPLSLEEVFSIDVSGKTDPSFFMVIECRCWWKQQDSSKHRYTDHYKLLQYSNHGTAYVTKHTVRA